MQKASLEVKATQSSTELDEEMLAMHRSRTPSLKSITNTHTLSHFCKYGTNTSTGLKSDEVLMTEERDFSRLPSSHSDAAPLHLGKDDWVVGVKKRTKSIEDPLTSRSTNVDWRTYSALENFGSSDLCYPCIYRSDTGSTLCEWSTSVRVATQSCNTQTSACLFWMEVLN